MQAALEIADGALAESQAPLIDPRVDPVFSNKGASNAVV